MQNNFPKVPLFFSLIFLILSSLVFVYFYTAINRNEQKSEMARLAWVSETSRREEIKRLNSTMKAIEPKKVRLEAHFAQSSDIVPLLDTIEGLGSKIGVKTEVTSVSVVEDKTGLMIGLRASGTFDNLYRFLTLLENSSYELEFVSVGIQKQDVANIEDKTWGLSLQAKLLSFTE